MTITIIILFTLEGKYPYDLEIAWYNVLTPYTTFTIIAGEFGSVWNMEQG